MFYYSYLFERPSDFNSILHKGKISEHFLAVTFEKIGKDRVSYLRENLINIRSR